MARALWEINFNYAKAIRQSEDLKAAAQEMSDAAHHNEDVLDELNRAWRSDSSPAYIRKVEQVAEEIAKTARELDSVADVIRAIAERVKAAELEAWRIANERDS